jgi:hypothetical protein
MRPLVMVARWRLMLACFRQHLSYAKLTCILFFSIFFNQFLPASVGSDTGRIWYLRKEGVPLASVAGSVLMDRVCALLGLIVMIAALLPIADCVIPDRSVIWVLATIVAGGFAGTVLLLLLRPWTRQHTDSQLIAIVAFPTNALYTLGREARRCSQSLRCPSWSM